MAFQGRTLEWRAEQKLGIPCMAIGWEPRIIIVDGNLTGNIRDGNYSNKDGNINGSTGN